MIPRYLTPSLLLLAAIPASSAELGKGLSLTGWVDTIATIGDSNAADDAATAAKESAAGAGFYAQGSIKIGWQATDAVSGKLNLYIDPDASPLNLVESYVTWSFAPAWWLTMGKYQDHMGWLAAEPTGYYRVRFSSINYGALYGNNVIGAALAFAEDGSPLSGSFHVVNGYYDANAVYSQSYQAQTTSRENRDLGLGLDLVYDQGPLNLNLEAAYDLHSGTATPFLLAAAAPANGLGGDVLVVGLNTTIKPNDGMTFGGEVMWGQKASDKDASKSTINDSKASRLQGLLMANMAIASAPFPMSITGMVQAIEHKADAAGGSDPKASIYELTLALLTNPVKDINFALNYELSYISANYKNGAAVLAGVAKEKEHSVLFAVEGLIAIP